ncbi:MAG TPA: hypothetical protein VGA59_03580, partial [Ramlibacter sp.]
MLEIEPVRPETEALTIRANLALLDVPADGDIALDLAGRRLGEAWDPACGCTVDGLEVEFESAIL